MLTSISPLGERARSARWWRTTTAYLLSSVVAGAVLGVALGAMGSLLPGARAVAVIAAAVAVIVVLLDISGRVPTVRRQVNENWLTTYRDWVYGAGFGGQLGFGAITIVTSASTYLAWVLELLCGSAPGGAAIGATFGLARGLPLLAMRRVDSPARLRQTIGDLNRALPRARWATVAVEVGAVAVLCAAAAGAVG